MQGFFRGLAMGIASAVGSEVSSNKKKRVPKTQQLVERRLPTVDRTAAAWCWRCKSATAYYNASHQLVCRKCGKTDH